ncbi:MAG: thiol-disulfide oxidoreductase DCC family protein [Dehalococcoidia bacterium]
MNNHNIVFFDGYCILCNKFIDLLLNIDKNKCFYYTPLTSNYAKKILENLDGPKIEVKNINTVIYLKNQQLFFKSDAVIEIINELGGCYKACLALYLVPKKIRDWCYDLVAKNRYQIFGKMNHCRVIKQEEKYRILE